jgi:hypothetical protein
MRVSAWSLPVLVIVALLGTIVTAQAAGQWSISGRSSINSGDLGPEDIKGWMTLQQISEGTSLPLAELYALGGIPPDVPANTALKDLEGLLPGFEVSTLRDALAARPAGASAPPVEDTAAETPTPGEVAGTARAPTPPVPAASDLDSTPASHIGVDAGAGAGPTPLPAGEVLPGDQVKGRMSLRDVSAQCAVSLPALLERLGLPPDLDPSTKVKDLVAAGQLPSVIVMQEAVTALQAQ